MHTHEYQAKRVLQKYGIPLPAFAVVADVAGAQAAIEEMDLQQAVVKVQVHAGGRGKAGGVKIAKNRQEILAYTKQLIGLKIVNDQTGPQGMVAHQVLISRLVDIKKEYYLGVVIDRKRGQAVLIASTEGGMEIEEVAARTPASIFTLPIPLAGTLRSYHLFQLAKWMGWQGNAWEEGKQIAAALARAFKETDASLLEINPLAETREGHLYALDAKLCLDENALFRQPDLARACDPTQPPPVESQARAHDLAYIALDGHIGCMVNGAGLAMATLDIIQHYGGAPANFLDVGGGASKEKVTAGFKMILSDPQVKAILVNIFGGIMNCAALAAGLIAAASELKVDVPLVVRMEGTHVESGKKLLADSGLPILLADGLAEAAQKVVAASKY